MNPEIQEQINKINQFNENESRKVIEIKKLFSSKLFLLFCISVVILTVSLFTRNFVNQLVLFDFSNSDVFMSVLGLIGDNILVLIFPIIFLYFIFSLYKKSREVKNINPRNDFMNKIFMFRNFIKIYFILCIIEYISVGFTYTNLDMVETVYPEYYAELFAQADLQIYKNIGIFNFIQAGLVTCAWYSLSKATKSMFQSIIFDTNDRKFIELFIFMGFILINPILQIIGTILALNGYNNVLCGVYFYGEIIPSDYLYLLYLILNLLVMGFMCFILFKIRKLILTNQGSTNPLYDNENVYTINLDESE